jgi:hypothetical protein
MIASKLPMKLPSGAFVYWLAKLVYIVTTSIITVFFISIFLSLTLTLFRYTNRKKCANCGRSAGSQNGIGQKDKRPNPMETKKSPSAQSEREFDMIDIRTKLNNYQFVDDNVKAWFESNFEKIRQLFTNRTLRDFIFEPFKDVFQVKSGTIDRDVYATITQVAIINAVLAGLPGQMGVGVAVSMGLEGWMAFVIARHVGVNVETPSDIFKYFGLLSGIGMTIMFGIKHLLSFLFSLFSIIPMLNPMIPAEIVMTNIVGVLFWVGFKEMKKTDSFTIPSRAIGSIVQQSRQISQYQYEVLKNTLSIENLKLVGNRFKQWLNGDFVIEQKVLNGEIFAAAAMAYMLAGHYEKLHGPLGETFLEAIRLRWSDQLGPDASIEEIADTFRDYDPEALQGAINTIKGKMFEIMVTNIENADNDAWVGTMHEDEHYPGSDIIFTNMETGEQLELSLKATGGHTGIIESALVKYPDTPIMTTDEAAALYGENPMVFASGIRNEELEAITEERMDELLHSIILVDAAHVAVGGVTMGLLAVLWPFTIAYMRGKISYESYTKVLEKVLGDAGVQLASRIGYAVLLGPVFAWYLLARGVGLAVKQVTINTNNRIAIIY